MAKDRPFVVINCLNQGHAVAGPPEGRLSGDDFEMVQWGMAADQARDLAERLNTEAAAGSDRQLHVRD